MLSNIIPNSATLEFPLRLYFDPSVSMCALPKTNVDKILVSKGLLCKGGRKVMN
jgi:hypothetical protein